MFKASGSTRGWRAGPLEAGPQAAQQERLGTSEGKAWESLSKPSAVVALPSSRAQRSDPGWRDIREWSADWVASLRSR